MNNIQHTTLAVTLQARDNMNDMRNVMSVALNRRVSIDEAMKELQTHWNTTKRNEWTELTPIP